MSRMRWITSAGSCRFSFSGDGGGAAVPLADGSLLSASKERHIHRLAAVHCLLHCCCLDGRELAALLLLGCCKRIGARPAANSVTIVE